MPIDKVLKEWSPLILKAFGLQKIHHDTVTLKPCLLDDFFRRTKQDPVKLQDIVESKAEVYETMHKY